MSAPSAPIYPCVCPGHTKAVVELYYSEPTPDGRFFVSACLDKLPMLRESGSGDWIGTFQGHKGAVWSAKLNRTATVAATGSADFTAKLWNATTGEETATLEHSHVVKTVDFDAAGERLATGAQDKKLRIWSVASTSAASSTVTLPDKVRKVMWSPDARTVLAGGDDGVIRVVDIASGAVVRERSVGAAVADMELTAPNGTRTLTVAAGSAVHLLDPDTLEIRRSHTLAAPVEAASLHPIHGKTFIAGKDVHVLIADAETGAEIAVQKGHHGLVHCVRYCPDGITYASGADDATIRLWRTDDVPASSPTAAAAGAS